MKYTSSNKPLVCMQTQSTCYKGTSKMTVKGILWHGTGANNPTLKRYVQPSDTKPSADTYTKAKWLEVLGKNAYGNDWNHIERSAGLNAWIGKLADGTVTSIQTMPWDFKPWGCGSGIKGSCNNGWIQFEICEDGLTDKTYFNAVYKEACELTAYLCNMFGINPHGTVSHCGVTVPTILCHQDSYKLGLGGDHSDVYNWFNKHGKTMANVRDDVAALLKGTSSSTTTTTTTTVGTYKVVTDINKYASAGDAKSKTNSKGTLGAGTYYIFNKYPNGYDGMYNLTTDKTGAEAGSWINPTENVAPVNTTTTVKTYKVVTQINRYSTVDDAINKKNSKGTYDAGTYYIYEKYLDGYKGMYNISTDKTGKSAGSWVNPSENVIKESVPQTTTPTTTTTPSTTTTTQTTTETTKQTLAVYELDYPIKNKICDKVTFTKEEYNKKFTQVCECIVKNNSEFDTNIVKAFFEIAPIYGIDPVRAIAQSILETGWFKYVGSAVTPEHHNYCGLGVTVNGKPGNIFDTIENGVRAQLQHLFAYGSKDSIPNGETLVDERFKYVTRGIAPTWEELAGRWCVPGYEGNDPEASMNAETTYGQKINTIYNKLLETKIADSDIEKYFKSDVVEDNSTTTTKPEDTTEVPSDTGVEQVTDGENVKQESTGMDKEKITTILDILVRVIKFLVDLFKKN